MVHIENLLVISHYTGSEFTSESVLNVNETIKDANISILKQIQKNSTRRKKSQVKTRKTTKF